VLIELYRSQEMLELCSADWQMALRVFNEMGWIPERPLHAYASPLVFVKNYEGEAMHRAAEALTAADHQKVIIAASAQIDRSLFCRILEFVAGGAFIVGKSGAYAEARANGDLD
jgi:hypothetical protein